MRSCLYLLTAVLVLGALAGPLPANAQVAREPLDQRAGAAAPRTVAKYGFDGRRAGTVLDLSGNGHTMRLVTGRGGTVRSVVHGSGQGLQFPAKCSGRKCPHAVLQTPTSAVLNPGSRPISFGATVRLARSQTSKGQNVVQKGYSKTSSQYKLQVDGVLGNPSCVLVDVKKRGIKVVRSSVSVADGKWHVVECRRVGIAFRVLVDGTVRGLLKVPAKLSVSNNRPLSIGGKGVYADNDQFNGAVDDVWVRIG